MFEKSSSKALAGFPMQFDTINFQDIFRCIAKGFQYDHMRITSNTSKTMEATSFLYALIEILNERGLITIAELDQKKKQVARRLVKKFEESQIGLVYQSPEYDKYTFQSDVKTKCLERLQVCKAICCKLPFALSRQDVQEGIIQWDFSRPYLIAHSQDGYCVHLDRETYKCTVRENRPIPCRGFDCFQNKRWQIWQDYKNMILNEELVNSITH